MADAVLMPQAPSLALRTAQMAARLAELVGNIGADAEPSIERFLRAMAAAPDGAASAAQPLERLAAALRLAPAEVDLIVLAGLAEEHEGYAAALRRLSPTNDPFATCGLAAQVLSPGTTERLWLRDLLERGAAVSAGALAVDGDGPLFECGVARGRAAVAGTARHRRLARRGAQHRRSPSSSAGSRSGSRRFPCGARRP